MSMMASQITGGSIVYLIICSRTDQRKQHSSASLAFVRGIHRWRVNSSHKGSVTRKMFPFDDVIMIHPYLNECWLVANNTLVNRFKRNCICNEIVFIEKMQKNVWLSVNNSFHKWGDLPTIFTSDAVTSETHWRTVSWVTKQIVIHGEPFHNWPALRAGLLCCNFFGQPGSVSKFPPLLWVKLWVGWVGRGYTEISRYFPASWINWVTLVTKMKLLYSLRF